MTRRVLLATALAFGLIVAGCSSGSAHSPTPLDIGETHKERGSRIAFGPFGR